MRSDYVDETIIYYNSTARKQQSISSHDAIFPVDLFTFEHTQYGILELVQFSTRQSYYNIDSERNNRVLYSEDDGATSATLTIDSGNYNFKDLATKLKEALDAVGSLVWTVAYDLNTLKYTYSYTGTPASVPIITPISPLRTMKIFGFADSATTLTSGISSTNIVSIGNLESFFLHADLAKARHINEEEEVKHHHSNIFAEIPIVSTGFGGQIHWSKESDFSPQFKFPSSQNSNVMHFRILDKYSNDINLTDDYTMTLRLRVYEKDNKSQETLNRLLTIQMMEKELMPKKVKSVPNK